QVTNLHSTAISDAYPTDCGRAGGLGQPRAIALRAGSERDRPLDESPNVRLHGVNVLGQHRLANPGDEALERQVDVVDLDLGRLPVEQIVQFPLGELGDRLVRVEKPTAA